MLTALATHAVGASSNSNSNSAIAVLQKKMADLMKKLRDASQDTSPGAKDRLKLLQVQSQAVATQIQQLQSAAAQKAALEQLTQQQEPATSARRKHQPAAIAASSAPQMNSLSVVWSIQLPDRKYQFRDMPFFVAVRNRQ